MLKSDSRVEAQLSGSTEDQPSPTKLQTQTQPVRLLPPLPMAINCSAPALRCRLAKEADPAQRNPPAGLPPPSQTRTLFLGEQPNKANSAGRRSPFHQLSAARASTQAACSQAAASPSSAHPDPNPKIYRLSKPATPPDADRALLFGSTHAGTLERRERVPACAHPDRSPALWFAPADLEP